MKLTLAFAVLILLRLGATPSAAELPPTQAGAPPAFTWRGFHVGVNFGGGFGGVWSAPGFRAGHELRPDSWWSASLAGTNGLLGGVQAGYDYAFGPLVVGVEADWQAAGLNASAHTVGTGEPLTLLRAKQAIDWFGTLRGRVGLAVAPRLLIYGAGGIAYGGGAKLFGYRDAEEREAEALRDPVSLGYAAGGGVEWAFLPDWSARLEYLYVNLGRSAGQVARIESKEEAEEPSLPAFATLANGPQRFHAIRAGVNYRFNFIGNADKDSRPEEKFAAAGDKAPEISTHYLFGFTYGSDIETEGKGELLSITRADLTKRGPVTPTEDPIALQKITQGPSLYQAIQETVEFEHTLTDRLQYAVGVIGARHNIHAVADIPDRNNTALRGLLGELRCVVLRRGVDAPFGVTLHVEPRWGHVSTVTGRSETAIESDTRLIIDSALVPGKLFAAVNLIYQPQFLRELGESKWLYKPSFGVFGGLSYFLNPKVAVGGGLQYLHTQSYDLASNRFAGDALFLGPQFYVRLTDHLFFTGAFSAQVAGHSEADPRPLDLVNFTRYSARAQIGGEF